MEQEWIQGYSPLCCSSVQKRSQNHKTTESLRSEGTFGDHLVQLAPAQGRKVAQEQVLVFDILKNGDLSGQSDCALRLNGNFCVSF